MTQCLKTGVMQQRKVLNIHPSWMSAVTNKQVKTFPSQYKIQKMNIGYQARWLEPYLRSWMWSEWQRSLHHSSRRETGVFPGNVRFQQPFPFHPNWKSEALQALINLAFPRSPLITHRDGVKVASFVRTISYYLPCLSWAGSAGGNRWCVWQVLDTRKLTAWVRLDAVDTCPDHKV